MYYHSDMDNFVYKNTNIKIKETYLNLMSITSFHFQTTQLIYCFTGNTRNI